jgi:hypothetical protein
MDLWRHDPYAGRYDQERYDQERYGRYEDAGSAGYLRRARDEGYGEDISAMHGGEPYAYAGQEYGMESHSGVSSGPDWGFERGGPRGMFDREDPGIGQSQAGYGAQARSHHEQELDPDYLLWRNEQLRAHDRDYEAWRLEQQHKYDDMYRRFRSESQRDFGEAFEDWRSRRGSEPSAAAGREGLPEAEG